MVEARVVELTQRHAPGGAARRRGRLAAERRGWQARRRCRASAEAAIDKPSLRSTTAAIGREPADHAAAPEAGRKFPKRSRTQAEVGLAEPAHGAAAAEATEHRSPCSVAMRDVPAPAAGERMPRALSRRAAVRRRPATRAARRRSCARCSKLSRCRLRQRISFLPELRGAGDLPVARRGWPTSAAPCAESKECRNERADRLPKKLPHARRLPALRRRARRLHRSRRSDARPLGATGKRLPRACGRAAFRDLVSLTRSSRPRRSA